MDRKCLLAVYAHPDDESFSVGGIMRKYSDQGVSTALICMTRGEQAEIHDPALATRETLGQVRERELREACRSMGVGDLTFLGYADGTLSRVDEVEAVGRIVYHMRRLQPQVVITFDANGDYGHPDHMAVHRLTLAAFPKAGEAACYPEQLTNGLRPHAPAKLYAHAMAWSIMRKVYRQLRTEGAPVTPGGSTATIPVSQMGTPDEQITTLIRLDAWQLAAKMAAIKAHRTQIDPGGPFSAFPSGAAREWLETERFRRIGAAPAWTQPIEDIEDDLFAGIP